MVELDLKIRHNPETSRHTFSHFGPSQRSLRLLRETSIRQTLAVVDLTRAGLFPLPVSKPTHQVNPPPNLAGCPLGRVPARAPQHSLRRLRETSFDQTLVAVGSARSGLVPLQFSKRSSHGLVADLATIGPADDECVRRYVCQHRGDRYTDSACASGGETADC